MDKRLEERYIVIKIKNLDYERLVKLGEFLQDNGIGTVDCVVIEEDWPEYKPTVDALMTRVAKENPPLMPIGWITEDYLTDKSATTYSPEVADRWRAKGWPVSEIYAAPIAQAEQQPVAWVEVKDRHEGPYEFHGIELLDPGKHNLYAAPISQTAPQPTPDGCMPWDDPDSYGPS